MNIPFVDLAAQYATISEDILAAIHTVLSDRAFIRGPHVTAFEESFATFCEAKHCIAVGNGTDALGIVFKSLGVGPGDEVLVPANTFIATAEAVTICDAHPVFVDVDPASRLMDLEHAATKVTSRTKAIAPVHLYGLPMDMAEVRQFADQHNLKIVQDCAQSHGASVNQTPLAFFGDACCYSFFPGKNLGAYGDAGAIVTNDPELADVCRMRANHGRKDKFGHEFEGVNSRMDGLQGAVLNVKLPHLHAWTEARRANAARYTELLTGVPDLLLPSVPSGRRHVYHLYVVQTPQRDALRSFLKDNGVATGVHYPAALPNLKAYAHHGHRPGDFPVATKLAEEILSLPMYPELSADDILAIANLIKQFKQS